MAPSRCDREAFAIMDRLFDTVMPAREGGHDIRAEAEALLDGLSDLDLSETRGRDCVRQGEIDEVGRLVAATAALAQSRWKEGRLGFGDGVALFAGLERLLRLSETRVKDRLAGSRTLGRVLLVVPENESHLLGPRLLLREMSAAGAQVEFLSAAPVERWLDRVRVERFDVVGLSIGHDELLVEARDWIDRIRIASCHAGVRIMVGGAALTAPEGAYGFLNADLVTTDIAAALDFLDEVRRRPERAH